MSQTQQKKQQVFREKLQAEGADGFADGPRPWEQWDESGHQGDDRIWEGSARRIYPGQQAKRSIGDRLLSALAVVALATLMVGIAGVYLSTTSTPQLASTAIHPAPIVTDRRTTAGSDTAATATASLASLETLSPPAAGSSATPDQGMVILEPALQSAPAEATTHVDRVAVETVITEAAVTTTVYTQQPSQEQPELVASIETSSPAFTSGTAETQVIAVTSAAESTANAAVEEPAAPVMIARAEVAATEPVAEQPPAVPTTTAVVDAPPALTVVTETTAAQAEPAADKPLAPGTEATLPVVDEPAAPAVVTGTTAEPATLTVAAGATAEQTALTADKPEAPGTAATLPVVDEPPALTVATETTAAQAEPAAEKPAATGTVTTIAMNNSTSTVEAAPAITREIETTTETPVLPDAKTGKWVINLSSYTRKSTAERMLAVFSEKGIDAEIFTTMINDKPMHRIRVAGFQSSRTAKSEIPAIEQALGLEGAWVSRR